MKVEITQRSDGAFNVWALMLLFPDDLVQRWTLVGVGKTMKEAIPIARDYRQRHEVRFAA